MWAVLVLLEGARSQSWAINHHVENIGALALTLSIVCNYPHFMASYRLAYGRGTAFVKRNWLQLLAVPIVLIVWLSLGLVFFRHEIQGRTQHLGADLLGVLAVLMYLSVGWHYSKQSYGCMMVYASYDQYPLSQRQRWLIRASLHTVWFAHVAFINLDPTEGSLLGLRYPSLGLSPIVSQAMNAVALLAFVAVVHFVFVRNFTEHQKRPSATLLIPYIAFAIWWFPPFTQREFLFAVVPFFHSLQYLPFVWKMEKGRLQTENPPAPGQRAAIVAIVLVAAGFFAFELVPELFDLTVNLRGVYLFSAFAILFINIHHYFIDNVIWRFDYPAVREYLLGAKSPAART